jgi:hypothetical protein
MQGILQSLTIALLVAPGQAWWDNGHMITARIAYDELLQRSPDVLAKANTILGALSNKYEDQHSFVESATFPDKFKYHGYKKLDQESPVNTSGQWHYADTPLFMGIPAHAVPVEEKNVIKAIDVLTGLMADATADELSSYQLRCLIHYIGDIHQPLHATSMYSNEFPRGDRGGNSFKLARKDGISELHALWDSVVTEYANDWHQPLSEEGWTSVGEASTKIRDTFPRGRLFLTSMDPKDWAHESFEASEGFVYKNIQEGSWPSEQYISTGKMIAEERLAYGGYRLADTLIAAWGQTEEKFLQ